MDNSYTLRSCSSSRDRTALRRSVRVVLERGVSADDVRTDLDRDQMVEGITEVCVRFGDRLRASGPEPAQAELLDTIVEILLHGVIVHRDARSRS